MTRYKTLSGSLYDVKPDDGDVLVRQTKAGGVYGGTGQPVRVTPNWRPVVDATGDVGQPLVIFWGIGRDEQSPHDGLADDTRRRYTITSTVVNIEEITE